MNRCDMISILLHTLFCQRWNAVLLQMPPPHTHAQLQFWLVQASLWRSPRFTIIAKWWHIQMWSLLARCQCHYRYFILSEMRRPTLTGRTDGDSGFEAYSSTAEHSVFRELKLSQRKNCCLYTATRFNDLWWKNL